MVYVLNTKDGGMTWQQVNKLVASNGKAGDFFGSVLTISDGTLLVSAYGADIGSYDWGGE
jgi:hypothetical protein